jgi:hypothetical protein
MTPCDVQASGAIELYFYGEASPSERASVQQHLAGCAECRRALEDMSVIRSALSARPAIVAPPGEDWSGFMGRLDDAVRRVPSRRRATLVELRPSLRRSYVAWVAMAALIALVTSSVLFVARTRQGTADMTPPAGTNAASGAVGTATQANGVALERGENDAAFVAMSEKHFERSKLVVLGLTTRDARDTSGLDWAYERQLASSLLTDTRLYRLTAEQRGMKTLARVMGDLELVLLQTSMSDNPDPDTLEQLQRLIRKRDLVTKMEVVTTGL